MTISSSIFVNPWSEPSAMVSPFLAESLPNPYRTQMTPSRLGALTPEQQQAQVQASLARIMDSPWWTVMRVAGVVGGVLGIVHGYKRNNSSVGWAIGWGILGGMFPLITIPIALLQGFGKPKAKTNRRRNGRSRRRNPYVVERYGALIKAPSEGAARGIAERRMAAGETWTRILRVSPDGRTTVVGRYGRQEGGRGAIARRMNSRSVTPWSRRKTKKFFPGLPVIVSEGSGRPDRDRSGVIVGKDLTQTQGHYGERYQEGWWAVRPDSGGPLFAMPQSRLTPRGSR